MADVKRIALLFPGQGTQYPGMGLDFYQQFSEARLVFEEADDLLHHALSKIIFSGSEATLRETQYSQMGIFVTSLSIWKVIQAIYGIKPWVCAGLSLGEYTALTVGGWLDLASTLLLVKRRGQFMQEACTHQLGTMAVVMGLEEEKVETMVREMPLSKEIWVANVNCPGQVVISGTHRGIAQATVAAQAHGAKRVVPLQVQGAFHSGLMQRAQEQLEPYLQEAPLQKGSARFVMNVPGDFVDEIGDVKNHLIAQVTGSVRWAQGIKCIETQQIDHWIECGPGRTLAGMNRRIGVKASTITVERVDDLAHLASHS